MDQILSPDFRSVFNTLPGNYLLLQPNPPLYTILAVSDEFLHITSRERQNVVGKGLFEAYPENPDAVTATGPSTLRASLFSALQYKKTDKMPLVRYDVPQENGSFEERYWLPTNKPLLDEEGNVTSILHTTSDITKQVLTEKSVITSRKIEEKYSLFLQAPVAVCIVTGPEYIVELANAEMLNMLDKTHDIVGQPLFASVPEIRKQGFPELLDHVRKTGEVYQATEHMVALSSEDGQRSIRYYNFVFKPYYEHRTDKAASGAFCVAHDVTDLVKARKEIEESAMQIRSLVESAPFPIGVYVGREMRIQFANQTMLDAWGKGNNVIGSLFANVLPELDNQHIFEKLEGVFTTGVPFSAKNQRVDLVVNGKLQAFYFNYSFTPLFNGAGKVYGVMNTAADVTDLNQAHLQLKESQESLKHFKFMADQARDAFILIREDGTFAYLNDLALQRWGYSREEANALRVPDVNPIFHEGKFREIFDIAQRETLPTIETLHKRKDGTVYPVELSIGGITLAGRPHVFAVARDITDRKLAEGTLKARNEELLIINNDLDSFIYTASHDLKAPIANIEGLLALLSEDFETQNLPEEETRKIMDLMQESVNRFKKTINTLTDVVKLQQESSAEAVMVNVSEVISEVSLDLHSKMAAAGVQLEIDVPEQTLIRFTEKNMRSVIYNLLSNAIKFSSTERVPHVRISCKADGEYDVLTFSDNGLGIAGPTEKLFTMFSRFHDHVEGTGIGLYMVKKMMDNAGGHIEADSRPNIGTTFRAYFKK